MEPIKVGIVGFGRSGCGIHASAIKDMRDMFDVVAIADFIPERRSHEAFPNAKPYASAEALIADPNVEMVIVSTFNSMHAPVARMALKGGKHVLCEKPFGFTTADVDSMIAEAKAAGKVLQPFQQRRFEEDFQKVRSIIRSGILGKISYIQICWDGFGRRWDWQTSRQYGGGQLYNNMPHLVDHAMELFGDGEPEVQCMVASSLSIGPAEDEVHLTLTGKDKPIIRAELMATN
ncbi:MAG: Gfo/Idh/MocA family oxidoreductase, partial [Victivallales bacterium]|nr:Gfo/Idh/MocA family oxidoreductase [Victivallales bacterium]